MDSSVLAVDDEDLKDVVWDDVEDEEKKGLYDNVDAVAACEEEFLSNCFSSFCIGFLKVSPDSSTMLRQGLSDKYVHIMCILFT